MRHETRGGRLPSSVILSASPIGSGDAKFRLVNAGWDKELVDALASNPSEIRIICPFIKFETVQRLFERCRTSSIRVITRFNSADWAAGCSDIQALQYLMEKGARIRGIRNLHAKVYIFGSKTFVTSANLTYAALNRNLEFGCLLSDSASTAACAGYFDELWEQGNPATAENLATWASGLDNLHDNPAQQGNSSDYGASIGLPQSAATPSDGWIENATQWLVKFDGSTIDRALASKSTLSTVYECSFHSGGHYPRNRRPRQVADGAIVFTSRLVKKPNDILIFGRAIANAYEEGRHYATESEVQTHNWKRNWPHYIRLHHQEFLNGSLSNGVSLNELKQALGGSCFQTTAKNLEIGAGNIDPNRAYMSQPHVQLTRQGFEWINARLEAAFAEHGKIPGYVIARLAAGPPKVQAAASSS